MENKKLTFSKIAFFTALFSLFQNNSISQTNIYHPFPTEFASWNYQQYAGSDNIDVYYTNLYCQGDTTINHLTYIKKYVNGTY